MSLLLIFPTSHTGTTYYVKPTGDDAADGLSIATAWGSMQKISETLFNTSDTIEILPGDYYGSFRPLANYGTIGGGPVTYRKYPGIAGDARFICSYRKNKRSDWTYDGGNIWKTYTFDQVSTAQPELLQNPGFGQGSADWNFGYAVGANAIAGAMPNPAGGNMYAVNVIQKGALATDIVLFQTGITFEPYTVYQVAFIARCETGTVTIPTFAVGQATGSNQRIDEEQSTKPSWTLTTEWQTFTRFFFTGKYFPGTLTPIDMSDCYFGFGFGTIPSGSVFYFDGISVKKAGTAFPYYDGGARDTGHISQGDKILPWKFLGRENITKMEGYSSDWDTWETFLASEENPGAQDTKLAMRYHSVLLRTPNNTIEGLEICYGAGNGFSVSNCRDIVIRGNKIHHIGGSFLYNTGSRAGERQGDGVNCWEGSTNVLVEDNEIWQCYDVAITNQAYGAADGGPSFIQNNIVFQGNLCRECEHPILILGLDPHSSMTDIAYLRNICSGAGYSWSHEVRPIKRAAQIINYNMYCVNTNFRIEENIFAFWKDAYNVIQNPIGTGWVRQNNLIIGREDDPLLAEGTLVDGAYQIQYLYTIRTLADYVAHTGFDAGSVGVVVPVPFSWGPGQTLSFSYAPGGYGSIEISPPWGGPKIWLLVSPPTTPYFG
ncbi:Right handed beta helix region [uncultured Caudovirales phage]|uniref:Right handed beta helix region n=1 Tax=uncultured Caudovirales phage TaxID=2100421 RepID=A0A6J5N2D0_9CAUD|nr:Right handed beta helix region [uncultured Caudovirales phage]